MGHKSFKRAANIEPIWFTLPDPNDEDVRFDCQPDIAAGLLMTFEEASHGEDSNMMGAVREFFDAVVVEGQRELFWSMINDRDHPIGVSIMVEVAQWLAGEYADRPTGQSSANGSQRTPTGGQSTGGAQSVGTTYSKPELAVL